jgi:hypothetical protein
MLELPPDLSGQIRSLALHGAKDRDIADYLGISLADLQKYDEVLIVARATRRITFHKKQTALAIEGNTSMLSLLGKHELGQTQTPADADDDWPEPQLDPKVG